MVSIIEEEELLDPGAEGPTLGDEFVFSAKLLRGGEQVGHNGVVCTVTSVEREELECLATAWFENGQITAQGLVSGEETFSVPITGGSGKYNGGDGEVNVRSVSRRKRFSRSAWRSDGAPGPGR